MKANRNNKKKVAYIADLHGNIPLYERLFKEAKKLKVDIFIGGDILPKEVSPESVQKEKAYKMQYEGNKAFMYVLASVQRDFIKKYLVPKVREFKRTGKSIYLMFGNDDLACNLDLLEQAEHDGLVKLLYDKNFHIYEICKNTFIAGYGYVDLTPFGIKDWEKFDREKEPAKEVSFVGYKSYRKGRKCEIKEVNLDNQTFRKNTISRDLKNLVSVIGKEKIKRTIFVMHAPPANTFLDVCERGHVGSFAIRSFIEKYQPIATLHGHIHESYWLTGKYKQKIGKTICVNPGQMTRTLHAILFDTSDISKLSLKTLPVYAYPSM